MMHDLRFALRTILAHRWFSLAIVATLALGIGLNTMIFTLTYAALFKPVPVTGGARLVAVTERNVARGDNGMPASYPDFLDYRSQTTSFDGLEAASGEGAVLSEAGNPPRSYNLNRVSAGMFGMLHTRPILGREFLPSDEKPGAEPVMLLGYSVWKERYAGSPDVIGHVVRVNSDPATIIGVMPDGFKFPSGVEIWMPLVPTADLEKRSNRSVLLYGFLKPGTSIQRASVDLGAIAQRLATAYPEADKNIGIQVQTFQERYNGGPIRIVFLCMLAAVGFVLLIVCANVANMMLSRALARQREMSIRVAIGASRWRVIRQLLVESLALSLAGGLLGLGLAAIGIHWFDLNSRNVGKPTWVLFQMDYAVYGYFALLCVLTGLLSGLAPALRASRVDLNSALKEGSRSAGTRRSGFLSSVLVVFQFALTLILLTGAGIFVRAFLAAQQINAWVPADHLLTAGVYLPHERYADADSRVRFFDQLLPQLRAIPGVSRAALTSSPPGMGTGSRRVEIEGAPPVDPQKLPLAAVLAQSPGAFGTIDLAILRGRDFNDTDGKAGTKCAIVTRDFASKFWPNQEPLGKRLRFYDDDKLGDWLTVIGVSADIVQQTNRDVRDPLVFVPYRQEGYGGMTLMLRTDGNPLSLSSSMRGAVQNIDQDLPLSDVSTLAEVIYHNQWYLRLFGTLFFAFAAIALLIASVGIYAVIAQATTSRTQEIGVRMALGASSGNILGLVLARGMKQLLAGFVIGLAAAYPAARVMTAIPLHVSASDPVLFVTISALLISVGFFACYLPARRAAALDPVKAIRYE
jgi:predicted permease